MLHDHCVSANLEDRCIPRPEMVLSLISVVLVLLVGELGVKLSSRSPVDLVPRVGGLGTNFFSGMHRITTSVRSAQDVKETFSL